MAKEPHKTYKEACKEKDFEKDQTDTRAFGGDFIEIEDDGDFNIENNKQVEAIGEEFIEEEANGEKDFEKDATDTLEIIEEEAIEDKDTKKEETRADEIRKEIIEKEDDEEYYLKHDCVGRFQFNYNQTTAMSHDTPEMDVPDAPIIISPGEGRYFTN